MRACPCVIFYLCVYIYIYMQKVGVLYTNICFSLFVFRRTSVSNSKRSYKLEPALFWSVGLAVPESKPKQGSKLWVSSTSRFMGSYNLGDKSPNIGYTHSYPAYIPTYNYQVSYFGDIPGFEGLGAWRMQGKPKPQVDKTLSREAESPSPELGEAFKAFELYY